MTSILNKEGADLDERSKLDNKFSHLWHLIGNTPMLEITYRYKENIRKIYVKCEHYNLTGSIKDRMALYIMEKAYRTGQIKKGDTILRQPVATQAFLLAPSAGH